MGVTMGSKGVRKTASGEEKKKINLLYEWPTKCFCVGHGKGKALGQEVGRPCLPQEARWSVWSWCHCGLAEQFVKPGKMPCSFQAGLQKYGLQIGSFQQRPMLTRPAELLYAALAAA